MKTTIINIQVQNVKTEDLEISKEDFYVLDKGHIIIKKENGDIDSIKYIIPWTSIIMSFE